MPAISVDEYARRSVELRAALRDSIQILSNARRAEVWETVNQLIRLEGEATVAGITEYD